MARRKQRLLSDGSDSGSGDDTGSDIDFDSQEDEDSRAERRLFERRQRKRPRTGGSGKEASWQGIFGEGDSDMGRRAGGGIGSRQGASKGTGSRSDWTKYVLTTLDLADSGRAPAFVSGQNRGMAAASEDKEEETKSVEDDPDDGEETNDNSDDSDDLGNTDSNDNSSPPTPRVRELEDEDGQDAPRGMGYGGLGSMRKMLQAEGLPSSTASSRTPNPPSAEQPSAFGRRAAAFHDNVSKLAGSGRSNFQSSRSSTPTPAAPKPADLSKADQAHLSKVSGTFGANMLRKFGWTPGKGLGAGEDGRAVPIAVGMLNRGEGIKSGIRTEDSKREARRKGDIEDDVATAERKKPKGSGKKLAASDGWKKHKHVKVKVEHKTYEQLIAEDDTTRAGVGLVLDARGGELKAVESLSELSISGWTPTSDVGQLPELRHNLRLILDITKGDVGNLVKEGKSVDERRRWTIREEERFRAKQDDAAENLRRLQRVHSLVSEIASISERTAKSDVASLEPLVEPFNRLLSEFKDEYSRLSLDDVVVGAIDLVLKPTLSSWQPFDVSSDALLSSLKPWRKALKISTEAAGNPSDADREMTAWESLLWYRWLPKVRSTINNEWSPTDAWPAVHLVESWESLLPVFIRDNVLSQLVVPKVMAAIESWTGRGKGQVSLAAMVFPWLPLLGDRHGEVLEEGKRRIRSLLRRWKPADGFPAELPRWRTDIFSPREWDSLIAEHVLGKLGSVLRDLVINPRDQDMTAVLTDVMPWHSLIRLSNFTRLFELEFFPKWLNVLYLWLVHPGYNGEEVAQWFEMWKRAFPAEVLSHKAIAHGFDTGVRLMGEALALGASAPKDLQRPVYSPLSRPAKSSVGTPTMASGSTAAHRNSARHDDDITFRNITEDYISSNDLLMVPLGKSHSTTGKPLFRVGKSIDGKGGVTIYVGEDAVFAQAENGDFRAVALDDVVRRAGGGT